MQKTYIQLLEDQKRIMETFDFEKVHSYMKEIDWQWRGEGVPEPRELKMTAFTLLSNVINADEPASNSSTGGFTAYKMPWGLSLHFSLERKAGY